MTNKSRLAKLESARPGQLATDNREFIQRIDGDGVKYFIDGVEVDAAQFGRECNRGKADENITVTILGFGAIEADKDGEP